MFLTHCLTEAENLEIGGQSGGTKKFATLWVNSSGNLSIEAERVDNSNFLICRNISGECMWMLVNDAHE